MQTRTPETKIDTAENQTLSTATTQARGQKKIAGIVAGIIAFGLTYWGAQQIFFKPHSFDKIMMQAASELNKTCPIMVDQETRLDNAIALPPNSFQYNYTLVNLTKDEVDADLLKEHLEPGIINNIRTNPDMKMYRDNQTTIIYYYKDKKGVFIQKLSFTPDMYQ